MHVSSTATCMFPPLPHACFFHFSDTCSLGSNGSTKFLESTLPLIPFWRAGPALVLECYEKSQNSIYGTHSPLGDYLPHLDKELEAKSSVLFT
jgi:hypothetical protein